MLILGTKLHIPSPRPKRVFRVELIEKLNKGLQGKLSLISAPAGFGKSTLLSEWIETCKQSVAWISLDSQDNDQTRFLAYLIAAFQTVSPSFGIELLKLLNSPEQIPTETILVRLLNEVSTLNSKTILVLDDYHLIKAESVDNVLTFLIDHLPDQLHIIIAAREHPRFPLARLRSQNQLTELLDSDLRFTSHQITEFLNQIIGLNLTMLDIEILEKRTEGWIAGLQLAALALQGASKQRNRRGQDISNFIKSFTGDHQFVIDYLVEEVLQLQSEEVTTFLLHTSILNRFCAPLCDATLLTPIDSSQEVLDYLEQANLLVVPLDHERKWYRYHHLFAEALQARLGKEQPEQVANLHRHASLWYEQNEFRADAIEHALAAEDFARAADLIDQDWAENGGTYFRSETWLGWVKALPEDFVHNRPRLSLVFVWELLFFGELEAAENRVNQLDQILKLAAEKDKSSAGMQVVNENEYRSLRASLAIAQAFHAQAQGEINDTVKHTRQALTFVSETDYHTQGLANSLQGLAHLTKGDLDTAFQKMAEGKANMHRVENLLLATSSTFVLANIRVTQGRLHDAVSTYKQALQHVSAHQGDEIPGTADLYLGLSELYHEQGNAKEAAQHLERCETLGKPAALPEWPYPLYLVQARLKQSHGELDDAVELLSQAEGYYQRGPVPNLRPVAAIKARMLVVQGQVAEALDWVKRQNLSVADNLSYLHEFEHITLARVLIAQFQNDGVVQHISDVLELLERLQKAAEDGGRTGSLIEILTLQAIAHQAQGSTDLAHQPLEMALSLAEPEGYVRLFVDEGAPMAALLRTAEARGVFPTYAKKLLAALDAEKQLRLNQANGPIQPSAPQSKVMVEPLSERELEILSLIAVGKKNQEIADQLIISLNTIRYHTKNLYGKLGVNKRTQAVAKAQELGLI